MNDVMPLAGRIANTIETTSSFLKKNWKTIVVVCWMMLVTMTLIKQQQAIEKASSHNQVANLRMAVDDVRYSVEAMEVDTEKMQRSVTRMDTAIKNVDSSVNRINTQLRAQP